MANSKWIQRALKIEGFDFLALEVIFYIKFD